MSQTMIVLTFFLHISQEHPAQEACQARRESSAADAERPRGGDQEDPQVQPAEDTTKGNTAA